MAESDLPGVTGFSVPRRGFLLGGAGLATTMLTGCGLTAGSEDSGEHPGYPVTVNGKLGPTTLKAPPKRVVAAGYLRDTDLALALGANLVGVVQNPVFPSGLAPWQQLPDKPEMLDGAEGLPWERIAALNPNLIMASDDYQLAQDYQRLHRIAPTLGYRDGVGKDGWETMIQRAAKLFGKRRRAEELVTGVRNKITETKRKHPELTGKTFTFGPVLADGQVATVNSEADAAATFFSQLGLRLSPKVLKLPASSTAGRAQISAEQLDVLDADVLIISAVSQEAQAKFESNPLFGRLNAVKRGAYIALDMPTAISLAFPSVLSIPYGLDTTVPKLVDAVRASASG